MKNHQSRHFSISSFFFFILSPLIGHFRSLQSGITMALSASLGNCILGMLFLFRFCLINLIIPSLVLNKRTGNKIQEIIDRLQVERFMMGIEKTSRNSIVAIFEKPSISSFFCFLILFFYSFATDRTFSLAPMLYNNGTVNQTGQYYTRHAFFIYVLFN